MKTLYKGAYTGCPIELAPTGYLIWCLNKAFMENLSEDIYKELKMRKLAVDEGFSIMPQPLSHQAWLTYSWFADFDSETQKQYMSMVENDSKYLSPEHKKFADYYNNINSTLNAFAFSVLTEPQPEPEVVSEYQQHYNNFYELFERK